jgi:hypothetical protein
MSQDRIPFLRVSLQGKGRGGVLVRLTYERGILCSGFWQWC